MTDAVENPPSPQPPAQEPAPSTPAEETKGEDQKPQRAKPVNSQTAENEIRVASNGQIKNYLGYAFRILNKTTHKDLKIKATGNAIVKALILIELVKRRVGGLHQINKIYSLEITSYEEPKVEGMGKIENKRRVTAMDTVLSKEPLDEQDPGYQQPEPKEEGSTHTHKKRNPRNKKQYNAPLDKEEEKEGKPDGKQRQDRKQEQKKAKKPQKPKEPKEPRDPKDPKEPKETKEGKPVDPKHRPNLRDRINEEKGDGKPRRNKDAKRGGRKHEGRPKFNDDFDIQHKGKGQRPPPEFYPGPQGPGYFGPRGYDAPYPRPYRGGYYGEYGHNEFMGYPPHRPMPQGEFFPGPPRFEHEPRRGGPRDGGYRDDPRDGMPPRGHPMRGQNPPREHMRGPPMRGGHHDDPEMPPPDMMRGFPMRGRGGMRGGMMRGGPPGQPFRGGMPMRGGMRGRGQPPAGGPHPPKDEGPREQATVHKRQRGGQKQYNN